MLMLALLIPSRSIAKDQGLAMPARADPVATAQIATTRDEPGQSFRDCADCPEMVVLPAGSFTMGSPDDEPGRDDREGPLRRVSIRQFAVGKFDVIRGQWAAFVSATNRETRGGCFWTGRSGSKPDPAGSWRDAGFPQDDDHPVVCVTWDDAQAYVRWLSQRAGHSYRLLTEAEWEYAARAGTTTPHPWGSTATHEYANYGAETCCSPLAAGRDRWEQTSPVGAFPPNAFGLYDMHGNVLQWVQDCLAPSYAGLPTDGSAYETVVELKMGGRFSYITGTSSCSYRMLRGGDWNDPPRMIRSAYRNFGPGPGATLQNYHSTGVSFRVARTLE
jgi:formylglycine-generating enzyme required for sulfatase activity